LVLRKRSQQERNRRQGGGNESDSAGLFFFNILFPFFWLSLFFNILFPFFDSLFFMEPEQEPEPHGKANPSRYDARPLTRENACKQETDAGVSGLASCFLFFFSLCCFFCKPKQIRLGERSEQKRSEARVRSGGRVGLETLFFYQTDARWQAR
jgi:hypothetical protein